MNISNILDLNAHINTKLILKPGNQSHIKLSQLVFRVATFFQFDSAKAALSIFLQCTHDFSENLETLYSKLDANNDFDHKSYDARQGVLFYLAILKLCSD